MFRFSFLKLEEIRDLHPTVVYAYELLKSINPHVLISKLFSNLLILQETRRMKNPNLSCVILRILRFFLIPLIYILGQEKIQ